MDIFFSNIIPAPIPESIVSKSQVWNKEFHLKKSEKLLVYAESGKGKTTLINIMLGLRSDYTGNLLIDNKDIKLFGLNELSELRKISFSIVPQGLMLFDELSVLENIQIKNRMSNFLSEKEILELLSNFGILEHKDKKAKLLSFGQQQRLAVIRALCQKYDFLLMDEPFSHLDKENKTNIWKIVCEYADRQNAGIVITSLSDNIDNNFIKKLIV